MRAGRCSVGFDRFEIRLHAQPLALHAQHVVARLSYCSSEGAVDLFDRELVWRDSDHEFVGRPAPFGRAGRG